MPSPALNRIALFRSAILLVLMLMPLVSIFAQGNLIPCTDNCGYYDLLKLVSNLINFLIMISIPISAGVFAWAGINMVVNADNEGKRKESKEMMMKVLKGFIFILAAWVIVDTILDALLSSEFKSAVPLDGI